MFKCEMACTGLNDNILSGYCWWSAYNEGKGLTSNCMFIDYVNNVSWYCNILKCITAHTYSNSALLIYVQVVSICKVHEARRVEMNYDVMYATQVNKQAIQIHFMFTSLSGDELYFRQSTKCKMYIKM